MNFLLQYSIKISSRQNINPPLKITFLLCKKEGPAFPSCPAKARWSYFTDIIIMKINGVQSSESLQGGPVRLVFSLAQTFLNNSSFVTKPYSVH